MAYYYVQFFINEGKGYKSFLMVTFNFWKFTQIMNLPFFFNTMMMDDSHVAFL